MLFLVKLFLIISRVCKQMDQRDTHKYEISVDFFGSKGNLQSKLRPCCQKIRLPSNFVLRGLKRNRAYFGNEKYFHNKAKIVYSGRIKKLEL